MCAKSVGTTYRYCSENMDFIKVHDAELIVHPNIRNIIAGKIRDETLDNVLNWKKGKGKEKII